MQTNGLERKTRIVPRTFNGQAENLNVPFFKTFNGDRSLRLRLGSEKGDIQLFPFANTNYGHD